MFIKSFILCLLLSSVAYGEELNVKYGLFTYTFQYDSQRMSLIGKQLDLSIDATKCNEKMVKSFQSNLQTVLKRMTIQKQPNPGAVLIEASGIKSYSGRSSREGQYFLNFPESFKKLKIKDQISCKK